jgi:trimeric autotransporter adhesin
MKAVLFYLFLFVFFSSSHLEGQPSVPNPEMWVTDGNVSTIAVDGDYTYIGGTFDYVGPNTGCGGKLTAECNLSNLNFPKVNGTIYTVEPDGNGGWYIGGDFTKVGSYNRNRIAHILSEGSVDITWNPNANGRVHIITLSGSELFVGGEFTSIGGKTRNRIAKLNSSGSAVENWNPDANNAVITIAVSGDDIYCGGTFTLIGGQSRNRIAKLNKTNGTLNPDWNPDANDCVLTIYIS